jgi:hypothetical protein
MVQVLTTPAAEATIETQVHPGDRRRARSRRKARLDGVFVYLMSGEVVEFPSTTGLHLSDESVELLHDDATIAEYPRSQVYLVSSQLISPPVMF